MKTRTVLVSVLLFAALNLMGLGGVRFIKTWKNPEAQPGSWKGKKVAAIVSTIMTGNRAGAEMALVRELNKRGIQGVPGHTLLAPETLKDREKAKRILAEAGITGAVVMQVVDVQSDIFTSTDNQSRTEVTFSSSWEQRPMNAPPSAESSSTKTNLIVETRIFSLDQDKLVWIGSSKTTDAKQVDKVMTDLVSAIGKEIKNAGLVAK